MCTKFTRLVSQGSQEIRHRAIGYSTEPHRRYLEKKSTQAPNKEFDSPRCHVLRYTST